MPDAGGPETIPLEWCVSDGVVLDFTEAESGHGIADEVEVELDRIGYEVKERDIVLVHTTGAYNEEERYRTDHPGMTAEATRWLIERGADDGDRRHHVRPAGVGDVRAQAVLGGPPGDVGRGVLAPREPDEPGADRQAARLPARGAARQVGGTTAAPVRAIAIVDE